jgi:hypothetical protein
MAPEDHYREFVLEAIVADTPEAFWRRVSERTQFVYGDSYTSVATDPALLSEQRMQKLYQERYFKMEHALIAMGNETGVPASARLIGINQCHYAFAAKGRIGVTQSYVPISGEMPKPAAFRKQLAEMAEFERSLRLPLSDEPVELVTPKAVMGILLHSPIGQRFNENEQKLGALGLFIAYKDYSGWAVELATQEILAAYAPTEKREDRAEPIRKTGTKTGKIGTAQ